VRLSNAFYPVRLDDLFCELFCSLEDVDEVIGVVKNTFESKIECFILENLLDGLDDS